MILVTGATGRVGSRLTELLLTSGNKVRALSRSPEKVEHLRALGASAYLGDLDQPSSIEAALEGCDRLFSIPPNTYNQAEQEIQLFQSAARAGIDRIVKLSTAKAALESPCHFFRQHAIAEQYLKRSSSNFIILQANSFMQNFLWFAGEMRTKGTLSLPLGEAKTAPVDIRDVATVAARVSTKGSYEGKTYNVTGAELLSLKGVAAKFSKIIGRKVAYVDIAPTDFNQRLVRAGVPEWFAEAVVVAWQVARSGQPIMTDHVEKISRSRPRLFSEFVQDYKQKLCD